jgi:stearoyl-CoA desaturase (delta-9 desaturase)
MTTEQSLHPQTLNNARLKLAQRRHAQAVIIVSALGFAIATGLAFVGHPPDRYDLLVFLVPFVLIGLGGTVGFHRHFTHRSFKAYTGVRVVLGVLGSMAMQGTILFWVALHRRHHALTDKVGDPHSPHVLEHGGSYSSRLSGIWHAYIGWTFGHEVPNSAFYAKDLLRDRAMMRVNNLYFTWVVLGLVLPAAAGACLHHSWLGALSGLAWGGFIRIFGWHNMIWSITSLSHVFGTRDFDSGDQSTNLAWMAVPTLGEAWHNDHHAFPTAALIGMRWYQLDISGLVIRSLEKVGLAWDVGRPTAQQLAERSTSQPQSLSDARSPNGPVSLPERTHD